MRGSSSVTSVENSFPGSIVSLCSGATASPGFPSGRFGLTPLYDDSEFTPSGGSGFTPPEESSASPCPSGPGAASESSPAPYSPGSSPVTGREAASAALSFPGHSAFSEGLRFRPVPTLANHCANFPLAKSSQTITSRSSRSPVPAFPTRL